jgi:hypothetical protein
VPFVFWNFLLLLVFFLLLMLYQGSIYSWAKRCLFF